MTIFDLQDTFHDSSDEGQQDEIRENMRNAGFSGVADTIQPVGAGGTDWRDDH